MSQYEPLIPKYPPASIPEIVAHIQKYLALNGVVPGVASVCGVMPNNDHNIPLKGSDIPLQSMSVQTIAQAIEALSTSINNLNDLLVALGPIANLTSESDTAALAASQGKVLSDQIEALGPVNNLTSESDTAALAASQGKVLSDQIGALGPVNNLTSDSTTAALSAAQGKVLNSKTEFNLLEGSDLNLMVPVGNHIILFFNATNIINGPPNAAVIFGITMKFDDNNLTQLVMSNDTYTYTRYRLNGTWTSWAKLQVS